MTAILTFELDLSQYLDITIFKVSYSKECKQQKLWFKCYLYLYATLCRDIVGYLPVRLYLNTDFRQGCAGQHGGNF